MNTRALALALVLGGTAHADPESPRLSPSAITAAPPRTARARYTSVHGCYENMLRHGYQTHGKVQLLLEVDADGRVVRAEVRDTTLTDAAFLACVRQRALSWQLGVAEPGTQLTYALVFQPGR